jgi:hypothetical protein
MRSEDGERLISSSYMIKITGWAPGSIESNPEKAVLGYLKGILATGADICDH